MSFLDRFKKNPQGPSITVRVWINQAEKEIACIKMAKDDPAFVFIAWSQVTCKLFLELFRKHGIPNEVLLSRLVFPSRVEGGKYLLLERHYDHDKEIEFLEYLKAEDVLAYVSLSDPLMSSFDANRIQKVMQSMGHQEGEYIEHKMIDKSIERAMKKIKEDGLTEDLPERVREWVESIA